jgi:hypothetical protein
MFALALAAPACTMQQRQDVTVVIRPDEQPLRGYATGSISLGEGPGDLTAAQINASLAGYGAWFDSAEYGRVWRPDRGLVGAAFVPYGTAGQWLATDVGWYWQSDYPWGRVPFHYGRWVLDGSVWSWVPGSQFAPAWVDWRAGGGWVGWAALAPVGARSWAPFVYCAHRNLAGPGLDARLVRDAAASSLFARTAALPADGDAPRGPSAQGVVDVAGLWRVPVAVRSEALAAAADGVEALERIPVARVAELPPLAETAAPASGPTLVIRDRDLAGMSEGPSVRRPAGAVAALPDPVSPGRPAGPVVVPPAAWTRLAPPPLPPPPDGSGAYPTAYGGAYAGRAPLAFAQRRAAPSYGAPALAVAPSRPGPPAVPAAAQSTGVMTAGGGWSGARGFASPSPGPLSTVR